MKAKATELMGWHKKAPGYKEYVEWMGSAKSGLWKARGLYDVIILSLIDITPRFNLLSPLVDFLSVSRNTLIFP